MLRKTIKVISSVSEKSTNLFAISIPIAIGISHASFEMTCLFIVFLGRNIRLHLVFKKYRPRPSLW